MPVRSPWQSYVRLTETTPIHQHVMPALLVENSIIRTLSAVEKFVIWLPRLNRAAAAAVRRARPRRCRVAAGPGEHALRRRQSAKPQRAGPAAASARSERDRRRSPRFFPSTVTDQSAAGSLLLPDQGRPLEHSGRCRDAGSERPIDGSRQSAPPFPEIAGQRLRYRLVQRIG